MTRTKTEAKQSPPKNFARPTSEATLRSVLIAILQETIPNLPTLREKEWAMREVERFKTNKLEGERRMIKNTGMVRRMDDLGRIVIPMELRRTLGLAQLTEIEISVDDANGWVVFEALKKYCHFCGSKVDVNEFKGKHICDNCVETLFGAI